MSIFNFKKKNLEFKKIVDIEPSDINVLDDLMINANLELKSKIGAEKLRLLDIMGKTNKIIDSLKGLKLEGIVYDNIAFNYDKHFNLVDLVLITRCFIVIFDVSTLKIRGKFTREDNYEYYDFNDRHEVLNTKSINQPLLKLMKIGDELKRNYMNDILISQLPIFTYFVYEDSLDIDFANASTQILKNTLKISEVCTKVQSLHHTLHKSCISKDEYVTLSNYLHELFYIYKRDYKKRFGIVDDFKALTDELFNDLVKLRKKYASILGIEPYNVFSNQVLKDLINDTPTTLYSLKKYKINDNIDLQNEIVALLCEHNKFSNKVFNYEQYQNLSHDLKDLRLNLAYEMQVKPYMIFSNEVLENIIKDKPLTKEAFLNVKGLGERKFELFGEQVIDIIKKYV